MTRPHLLTLVVLTMLGTQSARAATIPADSTAILSGTGTPGRKSGKGRKRVCKPVRHKVRRGRCTAFHRTAALTRTTKAGRGHVALTGRIGRRRMAAGRYRLTLTARDAAGNTSSPKRLTFTIVPG
jgi:hypothetical protein